MSAETGVTSVIAQQVPLSRLSALWIHSSWAKRTAPLGTSELASTAQEKAGPWPHATMANLKCDWGSLSSPGYELTAAACQASQASQPALP